MKFNLSQIKKDTFDGPFTFEETVDIAEIKERDSEIRDVSPLHLHGICDLRNGDVIFSLTMKGKVILPCARTLVDVPFTFEENVVEVFSESPNYGEEEEENEIHQIDGEIIDLMPLIQENVLLAIPYRVFSEDEEAIKATPAKGNGWEYLLEDDYLDQQEKAIDPRLQKLQTLLDNNKKD